LFYESSAFKIESDIQRTAAVGCNNSLSAINMFYNRNVVEYAF